MNTPVPGTTPDLPPPLPESLCHLNGECIRLCDAKVSVLDRSFIFGDGVYEVLPAYGSRIFRFEQHMARRLIDALVVSTGVPKQLVYIQIARGVAPRDHVMLPGLRPTGL